MAAYETAMEDRSAPIGASKIKRGSMRALATSYYGSITFQAMKPSSQTFYRHLIEKFCRETDNDGRPYGDKSAASLQRGHVVKLMAGRAPQPGSANGLRKVLRTPGTFCHYRASSDYKPDIPGFRVRQALHSGRIQPLVSGAMQ
jgi:hypothetical protein